MVDEGFWHLGTISFLWPCKPSNKFPDYIYMHDILLIYYVCFPPLPRFGWLPPRVPILYHLSNINFSYNNSFWFHIFWKHYTTMYFRGRIRLPSEEACDSTAVPDRILSGRMAGNPHRIQTRVRLQPSQQVRGFRPTSHQGPHQAGNFQQWVTEYELTRLLIGMQSLIKRTMVQLEWQAAAKLQIAFRN